MPTLVQLEKMSYLCAVVKETFRLGNLIPGRLPRVTPPKGANIDGLYIPGGISVSSSSWLVHMNDVIFAEPEKFIPERWSGENAREDFWVPFSLGKRDCVGRHLAVAEVKMAIAGMVMGFEFEGVDGGDLGDWRDCVVRRNEGDVNIVVREKRIE